MNFFSPDLMKITWFFFLGMGLLYITFKSNSGLKFELLSNVELFSWGPNSKLQHYGPYKTS
jgi:hypothetical protein